MEADQVVVATNLPVLDRGGFFARMKPARSYAMAFRTDLPVVDAMYLSADEPSRSLRSAPTDDGALLLVGGNGHATGRTESAQHRLDGLRDWTHEHWPSAVETHAWSAQDYVPHHALPFAGPSFPAPRNPGRWRLLEVGHDQRGGGGAHPERPAAGRNPHPPGPTCCARTRPRSSVASRPWPGTTPRSGCR